MKFIVKKDVNTKKLVITEAILQEGDESLDSLVFPSNVKGQEVDTVSLTYFNTKNPIKLEFEEGITKVGGFSTNKHVTTVKFPKSIKEIDQKAFYCCTNLNKVTFENNCCLTTIGEHAFGYTKLKSIQIPASVVTIGAVAFSNTTLEKVTFEDNSSLKTLEIGAFAYNPHLKYAELPDSKHMIKVGTEMFRDSVSLISFKFKGNNVNKIPTRMFFNSKLFSIANIPSKLKTIEPLAFMYCNHLDVLSFEHTQLKKIQKQAFSKSGIHSITLPDTVLEIGESAFEATTLEEITLPKNVKKIGRKAFYDAELKKIKNIEVLTMASVGDSCFAFNKFETLSLPPLVNAGNKIFSNNNCLVSVEIRPGSVELPFESFLRCEKLNAVILPDSVKRIGPRAFCTCYSLKDVNLDKVEYIGAEAFFSTLLTKIKNHNPSLIIGDSAFKDCEIDEIETSSYAQISETAFSSPCGIDYIGSKVF